MDENAEQLEARLQALSPDKAESTERVDLLNELAWETGLTDTKRAYALSQEALQISQKANHERGIAYSHRNLGYCQLIFSNLEEVLRHSRLALEKFQALGDEKGETTALDNLAMAYQRLGNYDQALQYAFACLELNKKIHFKRGEAWALHTVASIHAEIGDLEQALENFEEALRMFREIQYPLGVARMLSLIGCQYESQGDYKKALQYHQESLRSYQALDVSIAVATAITSMGSALQRLGDTDRAREYYLQSLDLTRKLGSQEFEAAVLLHLGTLYTDIGDSGKAREVLQQSLSIMERLKAKPTLFRIHQALSNLYESTEEHAKALEHYKIFNRIKEEVFNDESNAKLRNLQIRMKVESVEKEAEIHRLRYVELAGMQAQLVQAEKMALVGKLTAGMAHEVNNPVGVINNSAKLSQQALELIERELENSGLSDQLAGNDTWERALATLKANNHMTTEAGDRIAHLINSLKSFSRLDQAALQPADVVEGLESTLGLLSPQLPDRIEVRRELHPVPKIECYPGELNQCFMTLLVNASDAIDAEGSITVKTACDDKNVYVDIEDTGKGMPPEKLEKIFDIDFHEKESRIRMRVGLSNAYNIVQKHGGDIQAQSAVGEGTTFRIRLPVEGAVNS
jgi:signal transduction histidine kinase